MTDNTGLLTARLRELHEAARGCEFDLVPYEGPIARLALFMHENGSALIDTLSQPNASNGVRECPVSPLPSGEHQVDTSMESGPNNCFFCDQPMGER